MNTMILMFVLGFLSTFAVKSYFRAVEARKKADALKVQQLVADLQGAYAQFLAKNERKTVR